MSEDLDIQRNCSGTDFLLAGAGILAMEMVISNVTKRGDYILIVSHGYFGDHFAEIVERKGDVLKAEWGEIIQCRKSRKSSQTPTTPQ